MKVITIDSGFTLLEVLVSITILGLVSAAVGPAFHNFFRVNSQMERRTAAIEAAQQVLDNLRFEDPGDLPSSGSGPTQTISISDYTFEVTPQFCIEAGFCTGSDTRHIEVNVSFGGENIYALETVYTTLR